MVKYKTDETRLEETKPIETSVIDETELFDNSKETIVVRKPKILEARQLSELRDKLNLLRGDKTEYIAPTSIIQSQDELADETTSVISKARNLSVVRMTTAIVESQGWRESPDPAFSQMKRACDNLEKRLPAMISKTTKELLAARAIAVDMLDQAGVDESVKQAVSSQMEAQIIKAVSDQLTKDVYGVKRTTADSNFVWASDKKYNEIVSEQKENSRTTTINPDKNDLEYLSALASEMLAAAIVYNDVKNVEAPLTIPHEAAQMARKLVGATEYSALKRDGEKFGQNFLKPTPSEKLHPIEKFEFRGRGLKRADVSFPYGESEKGGDVTEIGKATLGHNFEEYCRFNCAATHEPADVVKAAVEYIGYEIDATKVSSVVSSMMDVAHRFNAEYGGLGKKDPIGHITNEEVLRVATALFGREAMLAVSPKYRVDIRAPMNHVVPKGVRPESDYLFVFNQAIEMVDLAIKSAYESAEVDRAASKEPTLTEKQAEEITFAIINAIHALKTCDKKYIVAVPRIKAETEVRLISGGGVNYLAVPVEKE